MFGSSSTPWRRCLALLLAIAIMCNTILPSVAQVWGKETLFSVRDSEGNLIQETEDWVERFPSGTFAFSHNQISLTEGNEPDILTVYRLGGGLGEVVVSVLLTPPADEDNPYLAASLNDYDIIEPQSGIIFGAMGVNNQVQIDLVFQENEYEKNIILKPVDDDEHESIEFLLATIVGVSGGAEFTEGVNRSTFIFNDNEETLPGYVGFKDLSVIGDRNEQNAELIIVREGAIQYFLTVDYMTGDYNAVAGQDYATTVMTVTFAPGETEKRIYIPLVQDYIYSSEPDLSFFVGLLEPIGGELIENAFVAVVHLINTFDGVVPTSLSNDLDLTGKLDGDVSPAIIDELEISLSAGMELSFSETDKDLLVTKPNLISLFANDGNDKLDMQLSGDALISNPNIDIQATSITNEAQEVQLMQAYSSDTMFVAGAPASIIYSNPSGGNWKGHVMLANADQSNSSPSIRLATYFRSWTPSIVYDEEDFYASNSLGLSATNPTNNDARAENFTKAWSTYTDEGPIGGRIYGPQHLRFVRIWDAGSDDPKGNAISKIPIKRFFEYYSRVDYSIYVYTLATAETGYAHLRMSNRDSATSVVYTIDSVSYHSNTLFDGGGRAKTDGFNVLDLRDGLVNANQWSSFNDLGHVYPALGIGNGGGNANSIESNLELFVAHRVSPRNLKQEYISDDGYVQLSTDYTPVFTLQSEAGIDIATNNPYVGSLINIAPSSNAGSYVIRNVTLQVSTSESGSYRTINTGTNNGDGSFALTIDSIASSTNTRIDDLSAKTCDTLYYKIVVEYEDVKTVKLVLSDQLKTESDPKYMTTISDLQSYIANVGSNQTLKFSDHFNNVFSPSYQVNTEDITFTTVDAKTINLGLDSGYFIIYNGENGAKGFNGDQDVTLDLSNKIDLTLIISHNDLLSKPVDVKILGIDRIRLYNAASGDFSKPDDLTKPLVTFAPGDYDETLYSPTGYTPKVMVVEYTKQPYVFNYVSGIEGILPATTSFNQQLFFESANQSVNYLSIMHEIAPELYAVPRQIKHQTESIEAFGVQAVSGVIYVPLGGDISYTEGYNENGVYEWVPSWSGVLTSAAQTGVTSYLSSQGRSTSKIRHEALGIFDVANTVTEIQAYLGSFLSYDTGVINIVYAETPSSPLSVMSSNRTGINSTRKFIPIASTDSPAVDKVTQEKVPDDLGANSMSKSAQPEFDIPDMNLDLKYFGVSYSGDEILINVGLPVFSKSNNEPPKNPTAPKGGVPTSMTQAQGPQQKKSSNFFKDQLEDTKEALKKLKDFMNDMKNTSDKAAQSKPKADIEIEFSVGLSINILLKYNMTKDEWQFDSAMFLVKVAGTVKISQKLPPPASFLYVYVIFGADVSISTGLRMEEEILDNGKTKQTVYFNGIIFEPALMVEVGIGIGLDGVASVEVYFKMNVTMKASVAVYDSITKTTNSTFDSFSVRGALGFRIEFLFITYEMDVVGFKIEYQRTGFNDVPNGNNWKLSKILFGQESTMNTFAAYDPGAAQLLASTSEDQDETIGSKLYIAGRKAQQIGSLGVITNKENQVIPQIQANDEMSVITPFYIPDVVTVDNTFDFGVYNSQTNAVKLADYMTNSSRIRLVEANGKLYAFYIVDNATRSNANKDMLVYSEVRNSSNGALELVNPQWASSSTRYIAIADDGTTDSDYDVVSDGTNIHVVWINQKTIYDDASLTNMNSYDMMAYLANDTQVCYALLETSLSLTFNTAIHISDESFSRHEYLPNITFSSNGDVALNYAQAVPYTAEEIDSFISLKRLERDFDNISNDERYIINEELNLKRYLMRTFGKISDLVFAASSDYETFKFAKVEAFKINNSSNIYYEDATLSQSKLYWFNNKLAYSYILELPVVGLDNRNAVVKNLYLGFADYDSNELVTMSNTAKAYLLSSLIDYELNDYYVDDYSGDPKYLGEGKISNFASLLVTRADSYPDPLFADIGFGKAELKYGNGPETYFYFNTNGRFYMMDEAKLNSIFQGDISVTAQPIFVVPDNEVNDGMGNVKLASATDGRIVALAVQNVAYTGNDLLTIFEYDVETGLWGEGRPLAMRGLQVFDKHRDGVIDDAYMEVEYWNDMVQVNFSNPQIVYQNNTGETKLVILVETAKIELQETAINYGDGEVHFQKLPKRVNVGSRSAMISADKQFFAINYSGGDKSVGEARLILDDDVLVPGNVITPFISFRNTGALPLTGSETNPIEVSIYLGNGSGDTATETWLIKESIPANRQIKIASELSMTLPDNWADLAGKTIYFTVKETFPASTNKTPVEFSSYSTDLGKRDVLSGVNLDFTLLNYSAGLVTPGSPDTMDLDLTMSISNIGNIAATGVYLEAYYVSQTAQPLDGTYVTSETSAPIFRNYDGSGNLIGLVSRISIGSLAAYGSGNSVIDIVYNNNNYVADVASEKMVAVEHDDLAIPSTYFVHNGNLKLAFRLFSDQEDINPRNDVASTIEIEHGVIDVSDRLTITVDSNSLTVTSLPVRIYTIGGNRQLTAKEMPILANDGTLEKRLASAEVVSNPTPTEILVTPAKAGQTILRLQIVNTNIVKDVIVTIIDEDNILDQIAEVDTEDPIILLDSVMEAEIANVNKERILPLVVRYTVTDNKTVTSIEDPSGVQIIGAANKEYSFTIRQNGEYTITARDNSGRTSYRTIRVFGFDYMSIDPVEEFKIYNMSWNSVIDINMLPKMDYRNIDISFTFQVDAPNSLKSIRFVQLDDQGNEQNTLNNLTFNGSKPEYRFRVDNVAIGGNGTYRVIATDGANNTISKDFTITNIDKVPPTLKITLTEGILNVDASDNIGIKQAQLYRNFVMIADLMDPTALDRTVLSEAYDFTGIEGEINVDIIDLANNRVSAIIFANTSTPYAKNPVPTANIWVDYEVNIEAKTIADSTMENDDLTITEIVTHPDRSIADVILNSDGTLTIRGVGRGNTSVVVKVSSNNSSVTTNVTIPITISYRPSPIQPNTSYSSGSIVEPTQIVRQSIVVAGVEIFITEQNNGSKVVVSISGDQLKKLVDTEENPLVFDLSKTTSAEEVTFNRSHFKAIADAGKSIIVKTKTGSLNISNEVLQELVALFSTHISILIEEATEANLNASLNKDQLAKISDLLNQGYSVYQIRIFSGSAEVSEFKGMIVVSLSYEAQIGYEANVWYVNEAGELISMEAMLNEEENEVSFATNHFSYYAVGLPNSDDKEEKPEVMRTEDTEEMALPIIMTIDSKVVTQGEFTFEAPPVAPMILGSRTMLPFRYLIQTLLGGEVNWNEATRTVTANINGHEFQMTIDEELILVDGVAMSFGQSPVIVSDFTLVPLRVFEAAVKSIDWHETARTVTIFLP